MNGFPLLREYCYLGVVINNSGSVQPQIAKIRTRSNYLRSSLWYFGKELSFQNAYLLWAIYIRPYFLYLAPVIATQTQTMNIKFH